MNKWDKRDNLQRDQMLMPWSPGRTISTARAAELLGVCQTTIRNMLDDGTLKGYKIRPLCKNSPYRVVRDSVEKHIGHLIDEYSLE